MASYGEGRIRRHLRCGLRARARLPAKNDAVFHRQLDRVCAGPLGSSAYGVAVCQRPGDRRGWALHRRADGAQSIGPADDLQWLGRHLAQSLHRHERRLGGRYVVRGHGLKPARGDGRLAMRVRAGRGRAARRTGTHSAHQEPAWPLGQRRRAVPAKTLAAAVALEVVARAEAGRPDVSQRLRRALDDVDRHRAVAAAGAATHIVQADAAGLSGLWRLGLPIEYVAVAVHAARQGWLSQILYLPVLMAVGFGMAFNNGLNVLEGLFKQSGEFKRTPKRGAGQAALTFDPRRPRRRSSRLACRCTR